MVIGREEVFGVFVALGNVDSGSQPINSSLLGIIGFLKAIHLALDIEFIVEIFFQ